MRNLESLLTEAKNNVQALVRAEAELRCQQAAAQARVSALIDARDVFTYQSSQATKCAMCSEHKHTPLRNDDLGGYICFTCIEKELIRLQAFDPDLK